MNLGITNFRSIRRQDVEIAPITVVYGPNGAGKSSLLYAILTLKNVALNSNQQLNAFFNYGFANLGGYEAVVFDHDKRNDMRLGLDLFPDEVSHLVKYYVGISATEGQFTLVSDGLGAAPHISVTFPYPGNQPTTQKCKIGGSALNVTWNGLVAQVASDTDTEAAKRDAESLARRLNAPAEVLRRLGMVPHKRGFDKSSYAAVPVSPMMVTEDEMASLLIGNRWLVQKVSHYLEKIVGRDFRVHPVSPGSASYTLDSTDRATGVGSDLVNDGFGVSQTVHLLAGCLNQDTETVCVEEPEIHMHPSAVRRLVGAFVEMVHKENKRFVITTHSEQLVLTLLALVARKELSPEEIACYLARKEQKETTFERQEITEDGQIEGGLGAFMEGELEDVKAFLGVAG